MAVKTYLALLCWACLAVQALPPASALGAEENVPPLRDRADVRIDPQAEFALPSSPSPGGRGQGEGAPSASAGFKDSAASMSVTVYSTYKLAHADDGVIAE